MRYTSKSTLSHYVFILTERKGVERENPKLGQVQGRAWAQELRSIQRNELSALKPDQLKASQHNWWSKMGDREIRII